MKEESTSLPAFDAVSPEELEAAARALLSPAVYDYFAGGAEDEVTLRANVSAFRRWSLRPRVLVDVQRIDTTLELLGVRLAHPILLAPAAFQRLAHADGEIATGRAARATETLLVASTLSTTPIEQIAAEADALWFQLYVFRDRALSEEIVRRAEAAGARALCLTVTVPVQGRRERDVRNRFALPDDLEMANFRGLRQATFPIALRSGLEAFIGREFDPSLDWSAVDWLTSVTRLPIVLKGITTAEDGALAVERGCAAVIVSNHGGRQLDGAQATLAALPEVVEAVAGRVPVLLDGGIRRGADVVKALALGARAVLVARPYLWGLAVGGEAGVASVVRQLRSELERTMALIGRTSLAQIDRTALEATVA
jgi:isopentenyl diphosphate isomerase/L-lactate dehydrogenase-like FMN-dependent dehydrogenase